MATDLVYVNGQAQLPQSRDDASVEWAYVDGQAGGLPVRYQEFGGGVDTAQKRASIIACGRLWDVILPTPS